MLHKIYAYIKFDYYSFNNKSVIADYLKAEAYELLKINWC